MSKVYIGMAQEPFRGSSCYNRKVELPGLSIETWANGGMEGGFTVVINGTAHCTDNMEPVIEEAIKRYYDKDAEVLYTHYNEYGPSKTVDPWNIWRK